MVKTKISSKVKSKVKTKPVVKVEDKALLKSAKTTCGSQMACQSSCWLCWLFKLVIVLFVVMIVFWLGFCFGDLSSQTMLGIQYRGMSFNRADGIKNNNLGSRMCNGVPVNQLSQKTSTLANMTGDEFDKEFLLEMTLNHQVSLDMAKLAVTKSARGDVKKFAQGIIDSQTKDIDQMKAWQTSWFK